MMTKIELAKMEARDAYYNGNMNWDEAVEMVMNKYYLHPLEENEIHDAFDA